MNGSVTPAGIAAQLDAWARSKGFRDHIEMTRLLETGKVRLTKQQAKADLEELRPMVDQAATAAAQANVDGTGLPQIQELIKSVARLIRVIVAQLLGLDPYTDEEKQFMKDRALGLHVPDNARDNTSKARQRMIDCIEQADHDPMSLEAIRETPALIDKRGARP